MACAKCGGKSSKRCCLCNHISNKWYAWGAKRMICWRCKEKQELLIKEREKKNAKIKKLLAGVGE